MFEIFTIGGVSYAVAIVVGIGALAVGAFAVYRIFWADSSQPSSKKEELKHAEEGRSRIVSEHDLRAAGANLAPATQAEQQQVATLQQQKVAAEKKADAAEKEKELQKKKADAAEKEIEAQKKKANVAEKEKEAQKKIAETAEKEKEVQKKKAEAAEKEKEAQKKKADVAEKEKEAQKKIAETAEKEKEVQKIKAEVAEKAKDEQQKQAEAAKQEADKKIKDTESERNSLQLQLDDANQQLKTAKTAQSKAEYEAKTANKKAEDLALKAQEAQQAKKSAEETVSEWKQKAAAAEKELGLLQSKIETTPIDSPERLRLKSELEHVQLKLSEALKAQEKAGLALSQANRKAVEAEKALATANQAKEAAELEAKSSKVKVAAAEQEAKTAKAAVVKVEAELHIAKEKLAAAEQTASTAKAAQSKAEQERQAEKEKREQAEQAKTAMQQQVLAEQKRNAAMSEELDQLRSKQPQKEPSADEELLRELNELRKLKAAAEEQKNLNAKLMQEMADLKKIQANSSRSDRDGGENQKPQTGRSENPAIPKKTSVAQDVARPVALPLSQPGTPQRQNPSLKTISPTGFPYEMLPCQNFTAVPGNSALKAMMHNSRRVAGRENWTDELLRSRLVAELQQNPDDYYFSESDDKVTSQVQGDADWQAHCTKLSADQTPLSVTEIRALSTGFKVPVVVLTPGNPMATAICNAHYYDTNNPPIFVGCVGINDYLPLEPAAGQDSYEILMRAMKDGEMSVSKSQSQQRSQLETKQPAAVSSSSRFFMSLTQEEKEAKREAEAAAKVVKEKTKEVTELLVDAKVYDPAFPECTRGVFKKDPKNAAVAYKAYAGVVKILEDHQVTISFDYKGFHGEEGIVLRCLDMTSDLTQEIQHQFRYLMHKGSTAILLRVFSICLRQLTALTNNQTVINSVLDQRKISTLMDNATYYLFALLKCQDLDYKSLGFLPGIESFDLVLMKLFALGQDGSKAICNLHDTLETKQVLHYFPCFTYDTFKDLIDKQTAEKNAEPQGVAAQDTLDLPPPVPPRDDEEPSLTTIPEAPSTAGSALSVPPRPSITPVKPSTPTLSLAEELARKRKEQDERQQKNPAPSIDEQLKEQKKELDPSELFQKASKGDQECKRLLAEKAAKGDIKCSFLLAMLGRQKSQESPPAAKKETDVKDDEWEDEKQPSPRR